MRLSAACARAAQIVSYEIAMGFALVTVYDGVRQFEFGENRRRTRAGNFRIAVTCVVELLPLFPMFIVYFIAGVAETNRAPFDVAEGESEIVAGFHVEYSGIAFGLFFLAEYANMILVSALAASMFLGGWLPPVRVDAFGTCADH